MKDQSEEKKELVSTILIALIVMASLTIVINSVRISGLTGNVIGIGNEEGVKVLSGSVLPSGVPEVYGKEMEVSFDDVSATNSQLADTTIRKLSKYDLSIDLSEAELQRYIKIVSKISCEYCCGAESIIFGNGEPACGCAHSYAMRGVGKYLVQNHPEMSDDAILEELGKWKTLFFPEILQQKAAVLESKGIEFNYVNLASNRYRGIEQGATGGGMVGGC